MTQGVQHPSFLQPDDPDISVWRYLDFSKFEWLAQEGRLYMGTADRLGDILEGSMPQAESDHWDEQIRTAETEELRAVLRHNRAFFARMSEGFRSKLHVSCWHVNEYENNVMWNTYTNDSDSVAIKTKYSLVRGNIPNFAFFGLVRYIDYSAQRFTSDSYNLFDWFMHKEAFFSGEQEARVVVLPPVEESAAREFASHFFESTSDAGGVIYAPPIPVAKLVLEVVLHPRASEDFAARVAALCSEYGLPAPTQSRGRRRPVY